MIRYQCWHAADFLAHFLWPCRPRPRLAQWVCDHYDAMALEV